MRALIFGLVLALSAVGAGRAEPASSEALIVVLGRGQASRPADYFDMTAQLDGQGATQAEAVGKLSEAQTRLKEGIRRMTGQAEAAVEFGQLALTEIRDPDCYGHMASGGRCAASGYAATSYVSIRIAPAARAGDVLALVAASGASNARLGNEGVNDRSGLRAEAARAAFMNARAQAEQTASAAGKRLGRLVRVQDPEARFSAPPLASDLMPIVEVRQDFESITRLDVTPQPVTESFTVTVAFAIEP